MNINLGGQTTSKSTLLDCTGVGQQPRGMETKIQTAIRRAITGSRRKEEAVHCLAPHTWILAKLAQEESSKEPHLPEAPW